MVLYRESVKLVSVAKNNNTSYELVKELFEKIGINITENFEKSYQNAKNSESVDYSIPVYPTASQQIRYLPESPGCATQIRSQDNPPSTQQSLPQPCSF